MTKKSIQLSLWGLGQLIERSCMVNSSSVSYGSPKGSPLTLCQLIELQPKFKEQSSCRYPTFTDQEQE
jgi:hypothetical protein